MNHDACFVKYTLYSFLLEIVYFWNFLLYFSITLKAKAGVISLTRVPDEMEVPLKLSQDNFLPFTFPLENLPSQVNEHVTHLTRMRVLMLMNVYCLVGHEKLLWTMNNSKRIYEGTCCFSQYAFPARIQLLWVLYLWCLTTLSLKCIFPSSSWRYANTESLPHHQKIRICLWPICWSKVILFKK